MASKKKKSAPIGEPTPDLKNAVDSAKSGGKKPKPTDDAVKRARARRTQQGVNRDGTLRKPTSRTPKAAAKTQKTKPPMKDGLPVDPYDAMWESELEDLRATDEKRQEEETTAGLGEGQRYGVGSSGLGIFDLPPRQRAIALRRELAMQRQSDVSQNIIDENIEDYISSSEYDPEDVSSREMLSGINPALLSESGYTPPEEADEYGGDAEATLRASRDMGEAGIGLEDPVSITSRDDDDDVGVSIRRNQRPGRMSDEELRRSQVLIAQRRREDLDEALSRSGNRPARLPVTPEEVLQNQNYMFGDITDDDEMNLIWRDTIRTDEPPVTKGKYVDEAGEVREGTITLPNRGYVVPPSVQDTRRRRRQRELEGLAEGSAALAEVVEKAPAGTRKSTTFTKVPKVSLEPGKEGALVTEDVPDNPSFEPTTFGDVESSLTPEQVKAIGRLGPSTSGQPTAGSRASAFRWLRPRQIGETRRSGGVLSSQLRDFSQRAAAAAEDIVVEPPLDKDYEYELSGGYPAADLLDETQMNKIIEALSAPGQSRRYIPFADPSPRPRTQAGRERAASDTQGGVPLGKTSLVETETGAEPNLVPTSTQVSRGTTDDGKPTDYRQPTPEFTSKGWIETLNKQDIDAGDEPGTRLKQLSVQYNLPNIADMEVGEILEALQANPRAVTVTPSQQVSRQAASRFETPEAQAARDEARARTGGPRGTVRRLRILRNRAIELGSGQAGLEKADETTDTSGKAEVVLGGNRRTARETAKQMEDFSGKGGGERDRAGLIRPGSGATEERLIVKTPKQTWQTSGSVPLSGGRPDLKDADREAMRTTHPTLASVLDPAVGMGRVVASDQNVFDDDGNIVKPGRVLSQGQEPVVGRDDKGEPILGAPYTFAHGPRVENPGKVTNVPITVPGGQEYGSTVVEPMSLHLATQFDMYNQGNATLPMVAGNPYKDGDWNSPVTGKGFRMGRVLSPEDASDPDKMRRSPAVRRAAAATRRMAGIREAKRVSSERKSVRSPEEIAAEKLSERRNLRSRQIRLAKDVSIARKRKAYESTSESTQDDVRADLFIQSPSVERQRSTPGFMDFLADYARHEGTLYRDNPSFSLTNVNKPGRELAVQTVPQPITGDKMDIAGSLREPIMEKFIDTMKARSGYIAPSNPRNVIPRRSAAPKPTPTYSERTGELNPPSPFEAYSSYVIKQKSMAGQPEPSQDELIESAYGGNPALATGGIQPSPAMSGSQWTGARDPLRVGIANPRTTRIRPVRS